MAAVNSLLFLLTTLSPFTEPPEDTAVSYTRYPQYDWGDILLSEEKFSGILRCAPDEVFVYCHKDRFDKTCTDYDYTKREFSDEKFRHFPLKQTCVSGCVCVFPKVRSPDGKCMDPMECPEANLASQRCGEDEEYTACFALCPKNCYNYDRDISCPLICKGGCICKEPKVRDRHGRCIMPKECPKSRKDCSHDEVFSRNGTSCIEHCDDAIQYCFPVDTPSCYCPEPKIRGPNNECIMREDCPGEEETTKYLESETSSTIATGDTYLESETSNTIATDSIECGPDEFFSRCYGYHWRNCSNYDVTKVYSTDEDVKEMADLCVPACKCKFPKVRGPDGNCIDPMECPEAKIASLQCREDEEYTACSAFCVKNCYTVNITIPCPRLCKSGCICKEPKVKNRDGICVMPEECPKSQEDCYGGEVFTSNGTSCMAYCDDQVVYCASVNTPSCYCPDGKIRGPNNECINREDCPKKNRNLSVHSPENTEIFNSESFLKSVPSLNPFHEFQGFSLRCGKKKVWKLCTRKCLDTCDNIFKDPEDPDTCTAKCAPHLPICACKPGFVLGPDKTCILPDQCPTPEKKPNCTDLETFDTCGSACELTCQIYLHPELQSEPCDERCVKGCFCKPGLVRDSSGNCILPRDCWTKAPADPDSDAESEISDNTMTCSENEEYLKCGTACQKTCSNYDKIIPCPMVCVEGCFCKEPMVRGENGDCVIIQDCPRSEPRNGVVDYDLLPHFFCKADEEFSPFTMLCPDTCENYQSPRRACSFIKIPGCKCKKSYVKGKDGLCIKPEECEEKGPDDCSDDEYFDICGSYCEMDCVNYKINRKITNCHDKRCKKGCFCKPGYVRSPNWECVPEHNCPAIEIPKLS